jgi:hypothetical protein
VTSGIFSTSARSEVSGHDERFKPLAGQRRRAPHNRLPRISPLVRNSLKGFATVRIKELRLTIKDVAVHESHGKLWAALPSKPQVKDGRLITDAGGKVQYTPIFAFDDSEVRDAFSRAVIDAVNKFQPLPGAPHGAL